MRIKMTLSLKKKLSVFFPLRLFFSLFPTRMYNDTESLDVVTHLFKSKGSTKCGEKKPVKMISYSSQITDHRIVLQLSTLIWQVYFVLKYLVWICFSEMYTRAKVMVPKENKKILIVFYSVYNNEDLTDQNWANVVPFSKMIETSFVVLRSQYGITLSGHCWKYKRPPLQHTRSLYCNVRMDYTRVHACLGEDNANSMKSCKNMTP